MEKWNIKTCLSIDNYEAGLIEGINHFQTINIPKKGVVEITFVNLLSV